MSTNTIETAKDGARRLASEKLVQGYKPEGLFPWTDEEGKILYYRIRIKHPVTGDKWIRPMHLKGSRYHLGEPTLGGKKPLYNLPQIIQQRTETIWIVEGEPKVERLKALGILKLRQAEQPTQLILQSGLLLLAETSSYGPTMIGRDEAMQITLLLWR